MNSRVLCIATFVAGIGVGCLALNAYAKKKYQLIADEEIESVKAAFNESKAEAVRTVVESKPDISEYKDLANQYKSEMEEAEIEDDETIEESEEGVVLEEVVRPHSGRIYKINPEEFDTLDDFDIFSFSHLEDGTILDDDDDVVENPEELFGDVNLDISADDIDSIYIRNELRGADYEILYDGRTHSEYIKDTHRFH